MMFRKTRAVESEVRELTSGVVIRLDRQTPNLWSVRAEYPAPLESYGAIGDADEAQILAAMLAEKYSSFDVFLQTVL